VRQCWRERSAQWCSGTTTSVSRLAITQSTPTLVGDRLCPALFPRAVYQGHSDGVDLPQDAERVEFPQLGLSLWPRAVGLSINATVGR
jgi:hypothetical protein